jgi:hypothetical protein
MSSVHPLPAPLARFRLPLQSGLLDQIIDKGMRARQRRTRLMSEQGASLNALKVMDTQLERCIVAMSLQAAEADRLLQARIDGNEAHRSEGLSACVFLRCALAIQCQGLELPAWCDAYLIDHPEAVRDALLFFPAPPSLLEERNDHIVPFMRRQPPTCLPLFAELIGRLSVRELRAELLSVQQAAPHWAPIHLALLRLGCFNAASEAFVRHALSPGPADQQVQALQLVGMSGQRRLYHLGERLLQSTHAPLQSLAWALHALDQPLRAADSALALGFASEVTSGTPLEPAGGHGPLPEPLWWRVLALCGPLKALMAACQRLASQDGPVTDPQKDFLFLLLGQVPPALRQKPNRPEPRQQALRELVLQSFRRAFVPLQNGADIAPWTLTAWASDPEQAANLRLRTGRPLGHALQAQAFPAVFAEVSQPLRQWLYFERAHLTQSPCAIDPGEVARRQVGVAMLADLLGELTASASPAASR